MTQTGWEDVGAAGGDFILFHNGQALQQHNGNDENGRRHCKKVSTRENVAGTAVTKDHCIQQRRRGCGERDHGYRRDFVV